MLKITTPKSMAMAEEKSFALGTDPAFLMEKAGTLVFEKAKCFKKVLVVAFCGNNGGDGFVCAKKLFESNIIVHLLVLGDTKKLSPHARFFFEQVQALITDTIDDDYDCVIDALFGIGFHGVLEGKTLEAARLINSFRNRAYIISIDIPSGLNGLTGEAEYAVTAHETVTLQAKKLGHIINRGTDHTGKVTVCDIGIDVPTDIYMPEAADIKALIPKVKNTAHKGTQGHIGIIAGSFGMEGAAMLASAAAIKTGAGKVSLAVGEDIKNNFACRAPEIMLVSGGSIKAFLKDKDVVLFGCGFGRNEDNPLSLKEILENCTCPLVIDADGLYFLTRDLLKTASCPIVLTPHMGEAARLFDADIKDLQRDPVNITRAFAEQTGATVLLKSNYNLITDKSETYLSCFGCPGMATAGSGDVLAGITASLVHITGSPLKGCLSASYIHGTAGCFAQSEKTAYGMTATDILNSIYMAFK